MTATITVASSPLRCPFCHDDVAPNGEPWTACGSCLARHHPECWNEAGACSSCTCCVPLVPGAATVPVVKPGERRRVTVRPGFAYGSEHRLRRRRRARTRRWILGALLVTSVAVNLVGWPIVALADCSAKAMFITTIF